MRKVLSQLKMQDGKLVCKDRSGKFRPLYKRMHRGGQTFFKINKMLKESFSKIVNSVHKMTFGEGAVNAIVEEIDAGIPVVMSVAGSHFSHAMLAIGYEKEDGQTTKILCLDPSGDYIHGRRRWNSEVAIKNNFRGEYSTILEGKKDDSIVDLEDILIITKN